MTTSVFVVSDLHLGGREGFRMCSQESVLRLSELVRWVADQRTASHDVHLVLNGDLVDFLAEEDRGPPPGRWSAFTADEEEALDKLRRILDATAPFWDALAALVGARCALTLSLGNHDIELALPLVRGALLRRIAPDGGRVTFLHDNEAFTLGRLVVEHGNRYDAWNVVDHDALRRVCSALSRRQEPQGFPAQPGSEMVVRVMNPLKARFAFVDLLKPETTAVAPILAVLDPGAWRRAVPFLRDAAAAARRALQLGPAGPRPDSPYEAVATAAAPGPTVMPGAGAPRPAIPDPDDETLHTADELADAALPAGPSVAPIEEGVVRDVQVALLLRAFRKRREQDATSFHVDVEADRYLDGAAALAGRGFDVVVFGHTHHAKRIALPGGATYLNSGTWADLMRIPEVVYAGDEGAGRAALRAWLDDLEANRIDRWRRLLPTFVRVDLDEGGGTTARDVFLFDGPGQVEAITTELIQQRLDVA